MVKRQAPTPAAWWLLAVTAVLVVHSLLEYPLWYAYFLGIAALALGITEGAKLEFAPSSVVRGALLVGVALGWFVLGQLFRDYVYLENFLAFRYRYVDATEEVNRRAKEMLLDIQRQSLLAPYVELGLARTIHIDASQLDAKLMLNGYVMRTFPIDDVVYRQAMLLALRGRIAEAKKQWDLSVASYPDLSHEALIVLRRRAEESGSGLSELLNYVETNRTTR